MRDKNDTQRPISLKSWAAAFGSRVSLPRQPSISFLFPVTLIQDLLRFICLLRETKTLTLVWHLPHLLICWNALMNTICIKILTCRCLWSMWPCASSWCQKPRDGSMIWAAASCYGQGSFFCRGIRDCKLKTKNERHWRLLCQPFPLQKERPDRQLLKSLKNWDKDAEVHSPQLMASGREVGVGRTQSSLRGRPLEVWPCSNE